MKSNLPVSLLCGLLFSLVGLHGRFAPEPALGQEREQEKAISVEVTSGRTFTGQLDAQTDAAHLWLRSGQGSAMLLRPIEWDRVVQVNVAVADLSGEQFLQIVKAVKQEVAARNETAPPGNTPPQNTPPQKKPQGKIVIQGSARSGGFLSVTGTPPQGPPQEPRVRSLAVEAVVANWDADVEVDGLLVYVYPLDGTRHRGPDSRRAPVRPDGPAGPGVQALAAFHDSGAMVAAGPRRGFRPQRRGLQAGVSGRPSGVRPERSASRRDFTPG